MGRNISNELLELKNKSDLLTIENAELRKKIALYEEKYESIREVKEMMRTITSQKGATGFQNYFLELDLTNELTEIDSTIAKLLRRQIRLSEEIKEKVSIYEKYMILCSLKEKLSTSGWKIAMLLQMVGAEEVDTIFDYIFEDKTALEILGYYYQLLEELTYMASSSKAFQDEFALLITEEEPPKTEREKIKREIRDNTIRRFYRKHGEKMFQPENMETLRFNLEKTGIYAKDISEARIKRIIKKR